MALSKALKEEVIRLRVKDRLGNREIAEKLSDSVSLMTISRWLSSYPLSKEDKRQMRVRAMAKAQPRKDARKKVNCKVCEGICSRYSRKGCCSRECSNIFKRRQKIESWLAGDYSGAQPSNDENLSHTIRNYLLEESNYRCSKCNWGEVNATTGNVPLQIDHIDGNPSNHTPCNLRVLCPNCHSLTPNYMALNIGRGRRSNRPTRLDIETLERKLEEVRASPGKRVEQ